MFKLELQKKDLDLIINCLAQAPYVKVCELISNITLQFNAQQSSDKTNNHLDDVE